MMLHYAKMDPTGTYTTRTGNGYTIPEGFIQLPEGLTGSQARTMMVVDGVWVPAPTISDLVTVDTPQGLSVTIPNCPEGTVLEVSDVESKVMLAEVVQGGDIEVTLPDSGIYLFDVYPPRPTLPRAFTVEVL